MTQIPRIAGGPCPASMQSAINSAISRGSVVVAAAGNATGGADAVNIHPANCIGVITVAATDREGNRAHYSNYGSTIEVSAPGGELNQVGVGGILHNRNGIYTTTNNGPDVPDDPGYGYSEGTSFAAPHVSGIVALMQSLNPQQPSAVATVLAATARQLPGACSGGCGAGIVNAQAALNSIYPGTYHKIAAANLTSSWQEQTLSVPISTSRTVTLTMTLQYTAHATAVQLVSPSGRVLDVDSGLSKVYKWGGTIQYQITLAKGVVEPAGTWRIRVRKMDNEVRVLHRWSLKF